MLGNLSTINYIRKIGPLIVCFLITEVEPKRLVKRTKNSRSSFGKKILFVTENLNFLRINKLFINRLNVVWLLSNPHWLSNVETTQTHSQPNLNAGIASTPIVCQGTIHTLRQQKEWVGWFKKMVAFVQYCIYHDIMAIPVVEFSREGYKIRKVFG